MTTEQYSIGYEAGYQDGFDAALAQPVKQDPVALYCGFCNSLPCACPPIPMPTANAAPVSAKREWVELEPWQLCEIEERIGLPIDSHDFETIGNAYIAAFKEKNK